MTGVQLNIFEPPPSGARVGHGGVTPTSEAGPAQDEAVRNADDSRVQAPLLEGGGHLCRVCGVELFPWEWDAGECDQAFGHCLGIVTEDAA